MGVVPRRTMLGAPFLVGVKQMLRKNVRTLSGENSADISRNTDKKHQKGILSRLVLFVLRVFIVLILVGGITSAPYLINIYNESASVVSQSSPTDFAISQSSVIYDSYGHTLAVLRENSYSRYLSYGDIPEDVISAFVSAEDRTFWDNCGFDIKGIARAVYLYAASGGQNVTGGSTITQQLVRTEYLTREKTVDRKIKEIVMSFLMSRKYSKEEIMEYYVNNICFANGIYGIEGAAMAYFNKSASELTLSETAYLCAIPNRPAYYDPLAYPEHAVSRRDHILDCMYECGYITHAQMIQAKAEDITIRTPEYAYSNYETTYAVKCAAEYLMELSEFDFRYTFDSMDDYKSYQTEYEDAFSQARQELYTGGYEIHTSLDPVYTALLQADLDDTLSFERSTDSDTGVYRLQGAAVCINNVTGKVIAVVGGRSQENTDGVYTLNRAYQSYRQPGSAIKPLAVYTPAFELGYTCNDRIKNISISRAKKTSSPDKLGGKSYKIKTAVEQSYNGCAWLLLDRITPKKGLSCLAAMHFSKIVPDDYNDAAALGGLTYGCTPEEMAGGYAALAYDGVWRNPTCITSITDSSGKEVYRQDSAVRIYSEDAVAEMKKALSGVAVRGTARQMRWASSSEADIYVKTGTTNDSKDGWLCGFTDDYTLAVWVGYDTPAALDGLYGSTYPAEIWKNGMLDALSR